MTKDPCAFLMSEEGVRNPEVVSSRNFSAKRFHIFGPLLVKAKMFHDVRGYFCETFSLRDFVSLGINDHFVQDNMSFSKNVYTLRGLHFQSPPHGQAKLVHVIQGRILDVVVDIRQSSPTFGKHLCVELSDKERLFFYVPVGFAHGFLTLEPNTIVSYKVSEYYVPEADHGILWCDPALAIPWNVSAEEIVLSEKDKSLPLLSQVKVLFP